MPNHPERPDRPVTERLFGVERHLAEQDKKLDHVVDAVEEFKSGFIEFRLKTELALQRVETMVRARKVPAGVFLPKWLVVSLVALLPPLGAGTLQVIKLLVAK